MDNLHRLQRPRLTANMAGRGLLFVGFYDGPMTRGTLRGAIAERVIASQLGIIQSSRPLPYTSRCARLA